MKRRTFFRSSRSGVRSGKGTGGRRPSTPGRRDERASGRRDPHGLHGARGTKVRIDRLSEEWAEVALEDGRVGWVPVEVLRRSRSGFFWCLGSLKEGAELGRASEVPLPCFVRGPRLTCTEPV